jgi:hypothetical protein
MPRYAADDVLVEVQDVAAGRALVISRLQVLKLSLQVSHLVEKSLSVDLLSIIVHRFCRAEAAEEFEVPSVWEFEE